MLGLCDTLNHLAQCGVHGTTPWETGFKEVICVWDWERGRADQELCLMAEQKRSLGVPSTPTSLTTSTEIFS